jgi:hypothetical protein
MRAPPSRLPLTLWSVHTCNTLKLSHHPPLYPRLWSPLRPLLCCSTIIASCRHLSAIASSASICCSVSGLHNNLVMRISTSGLHFARAGSSGTRLAFPLIL